MSDHDINNYGYQMIGRYRAFVCRSGGHQLQDIWQYGQNIETGEIVDMFEFHNHDSFVREMGLWNSITLDEVSDDTPSIIEDLNT
jgi:hypothetical protein